MEIKNFQIPAVHEQMEVDQILSSMHDIPGVIQASGDRATKIFILEWDAPATWDQVNNALVNLGYTVQNNEKW